MKPYKIGGLLRCCVGAIPEHDDSVDGDFAECPFGPHEMSGVRLVHGVWQAAWIDQAGSGA